MLYSYSIPSFLPWQRQETGNTLARLNWEEKGNFLASASPMAYTGKHCLTTNMNACGRRRLRSFTTA
jgi:hypothetical protein